MTYIQAIIIGMFQGITELFPVSSLGHSVILPNLLKWTIDQNNPIFLTFLVTTHFATALVLFLFFFKDWKLIFYGILVSFKKRDLEAGGHYGKLGWMLIVATIPAGILGLLFQENLKGLFASPKIVAFILILNGIMLWVADMLSKRTLSTKTISKEESAIRIAKSSWSQVIKIGCLQALALIPGFSRTGSTITGGLLTGLSYEDSARFSFLLATPIIGAASLLKIPELFTTPGENMFIGQTIIGSLVAGLFAYISVRFLLRYFETKKLWPFGLYCIAIGAVSFLFLMLG